MNSANLVLEKSKDEMEKAVDHFRGEVAKLRSDRASAELIEDIQIEVYGQNQSLKHAANITTAGPRSLQIDVWDQSLLQVVEKALQGAGLGASPIVQGKALFLNLPAMSQETRDQIVKVLHQKQEEAKISLRNNREEGLKELKQQKEKGDITEDEFFKGREMFDEQIHSYNEKIDEISSSKENVIRS